MSRYLMRTLAFAALGRPARRYQPILPAVPVSAPDIGSGHVYALINPAMPGLVKIGFTTVSVEGRAADLSRATGVPQSFQVLCSLSCRDPQTVEARLHRYFAERRVRGSEFFSIPPEDALIAFEAMRGLLGAAYALPASPARARSWLWPFPPLSAWSDWLVVLGLVFILGYMREVDWVSVWQTRPWLVWLALYFIGWIVWRFVRKAESG